MKEFKDDWVCRRCAFWRRSRKDMGICLLHRAEIFTEDGLRRRIRTYASDGCEGFRARKPRLAAGAGMGSVEAGAAVVVEFEAGGSFK